LKLPLGDFYRVVEDAQSIAAKFEPFARFKKGLKFTSIAECCRGTVTQFSEDASKGWEVERGKFGEETFEGFRD
jgi:hypothetical protein